MRNYTGRKLHGAIIAIAFSIAFCGCTAAVEQKKSSEPNAYSEKRHQSEDSNPTAEAWAEIGNEIVSMINQNWERPLHWEGKSASISFRLNPGGDAYDVQVEKSSGDTLFDESVTNAVKEASPFPVPEDPRYRALTQPITVEFLPK